MSTKRGVNMNLSPSGFLVWMRSSEATDSGGQAHGGAFARQGLRPRVVLSAADTDVIKTYVREGMGIGIIADLAYEPTLDADLGRRDLSHLFPWEVTKVAYLRDKYLQRFQRRFIDLFQEESAQLNRRGRAGPG